MSRAADLFRRLTSGGYAALAELAADREAESLFLDFKRSSHDGVGSKLSKDDNKNLSRAISGFGNSSGGVVVWGIDYRRDSTGAELATEHPLGDASGFATRLQSAISRTTIPPLPGVEVVFFSETADSKAGFAAVLVPQSLIGPIRSTETNHYHLRAGSSFQIVPHEVLAGLFGRPPRPHVDVNVASHPARVDLLSRQFTMALGVIAVNLGAVVAERPYLAVLFKQVIKGKALTMQLADPSAYRKQAGPLPVMSVVANQGVVVVPGAAEPLCDLVITMPIDEPFAIDWECTIGADGAAPQRFRLNAELQAIQDAIRRASSTSMTTTDVIQIEHG